MTIRLCLMGLLGTVLAGLLATTLPLKLGFTNTLLFSTDFLMDASKLFFFAGSILSAGSSSLAYIGSLGWWWPCRGWELGEKD